MQTDLLLQTLNLIRPLSARLQERFSECVREEILPRKHMLQRQGETARRIYFIISGMARAYYVDNNEKQCTTWFMKQGDLMISVYSFFTQRPAPENIELLEESRLQFMSWSQLQAIYADFPEFNYHGRIMTEKYYIESEQRAILLRNSTAFERYQLLLQTHPDILQRVSLRTIATHLNVSHEALCRIRARHSHQ